MKHLLPYWRSREADSDKCYSGVSTVEMSDLWRVKWQMGIWWIEVVVKV
jgi:hypothetical protein